MSRETQIKRYVAGLDAHLLGVDETGHVKISSLPQGVWNFNYLVEISSKKFVFKLYPPGGSSVEGMTGNSGQVEFLALKLVAGLGIAPRPVLYADASRSFNYPILIYEYVEGGDLAFSNRAVAEIAAIYGKLHSMDIEGIDFLKERSEAPSKLLAEIERSFARYRRRADIDPIYIRRFGEFIGKARECTVEGKRLSCPRALIHADPVPSNFVVGDRIYLIDWQTPMVGDPLFDLWAFMSRAFSMWDLDAPPTEAQKETFVSTYQALRNDPTLDERLRVKEPLYLLQYGLHCSTRYYDFKSNRLPADLIEGRQASFEKYGRTTDIIIDRLAAILG